MSDYFREIIKQRVKEMMKSELDSVIKECVTEQFSTAVPTANGGATHVRKQPTRSKIQHSYPAGTTVRVNQAYFGNPYPPASKNNVRVTAIRQHLGVASTSRTQLSKDIAVLLGQNAYDVSSTISALLRKGVLIADYNSRDQKG